MTVIKGNKSYNYPKPGSNVGSDTESLHIGSVSASDNESISNEPYTTNNPNRYTSNTVSTSYIRPSQVEEIINIKKSSGRKKLRRYHNRCVLQTLAEDDELDSTVMEMYDGPFARLLADNDALKYWSDFIEKSEIEQNLIVQAFSEKYKRNRCENMTIVVNNQKLPGRVSSKIKHTFKIKKNLSLEAVKNSEDDLLEFFKNSSDEVLVKCPTTSYNRLLLHAIAQYHGLKSSNVFEDNDSKLYVKIERVEENWSPADCFLTDFIQQLRME